MYVIICSKWQFSINTNYWFHCIDKVIFIIDPLSIIGYSQITITNRRQLNGQTLGFEANKWWRLARSYGADTGIDTVRHTDTHWVSLIEKNYWDITDSSKVMKLNPKFSFFEQNKKQQLRLGGENWEQAKFSDEHFFCIFLAGEGG